MDADARTRRMTLARWGVPAALAAVTALGGCTATRVQGTAIRGEIGRAILVNPTDPRLSEGEIAGLKVEVATPVSGRGGLAVLATGYTDENGTFSIPLRGRVPPRMTIRATKEGEYDVRSSIARPTSGEQVLILMRPPRTP